MRENRKIINYARIILHCSKYVETNRIKKPIFSFKLKLKKKRLKHIS